jgi:predicted amidohydrolase
METKEDVMFVCGLQLDSAWEDPHESFRRADVLAARAASAGAQLVVLPEMFATGFSMNAEAVAAHAEAIRRFMADLARRYGVWVLGGLAEPGEPLPFNACELYRPDGSRALHYRKIHPFTLADEPLHYGRGDSVATVEVEGVRVTPFICYDLRFPELFRAVAARTDLFVVMANWPVQRDHAWRSLMVARAIDGQAYLLAVNRVGDASGKTYGGDSALIDPSGVTIASAAIQEGLVMGDVDPDLVTAERERFGFLADRRPDLYRRLEDE